MLAANQADARGFVRLFIGCTAEPVVGAPFVLSLHMPPDQRQYDASARIFSDVTIDRRSLLSSSFTSPTSDLHFQWKPREESGMDGLQIVTRPLRPSVALVHARRGARAGPGHGIGARPPPGKDPCNSNSHPTPIPNCQNQVSLPITFNAGQQANIAYFCGGRDRTGNHLNFYILNNGWSMDNDPVSEQTCFQGTEDPGVERDEGATNFLQGNFTNLCNHDAQLIVTLACSDTPQ